jgi:hypothetical protein
MTTIHTVIHDRRIEVPAPPDLPDGMEVVLTIGPATADETSVTPQEIERVLAAMQQLEPLDIPNEVAADLDSWEAKLNQRGIEHGDQDSEEPIQ